MDKYTANRYIWLKQQIAAGGGSVPQELIDEVNALEATVNGDETQDPPVVGLVDIVGDLESTVEDLDVTVNGDSTTTPETPGLVDIVQDLDLTVNGDSTTTPETPGLVDRVVDLELSVNGDPEAVPPVLPSVGNVRMSKLWENQNPTSAFAAQDIPLDGKSHDLIIVMTKGTASDSNAILFNSFTLLGNKLRVFSNAGWTRDFYYADIDTLSVTGASGGGADNTNLVPYVVYGIDLL